MGARQKLNSAYVNGALLLATVVGAGCGSFTAFVLAALFFMASSLYTGDLRPGSGPRYPSRPPPTRPSRISDNRPVIYLPTRRISRRRR